MVMLLVAGAKACDLNTPINPVRLAVTQLLELCMWELNTGGVTAVGTPSTALASSYMELAETLNMISFW
jgi:hypothetical protein